jgi:hypothetical protein
VHDGQESNTELYPQPKQFLNYFFSMELRLLQIVKSGLISVSLVLVLFHFGF